jgi:hypothetical protein
LYILFSYRNTTDPGSKKSSITSISSHVPLMATNTDSDVHFSTQSVVNTTTDVDSFLSSFKTNPSRFF